MNETIEAVMAENERLKAAMRGVQEQLEEIADWLREFGVSDTAIDISFSKARSFGYGD